MPDHGLLHAGRRAAAERRVSLLRVHSWRCRSSLALASWGRLPRLLAALRTRGEPLPFGRLRCSRGPRPRSPILRGFQHAGEYLALTSRQAVSVHPSSVLFSRRVGCVVFNELLFTTRLYMRDVTQIERDWLPELAPQYFGQGVGTV